MMKILQENIIRAIAVVWPGPAHAHDDFTELVVDHKHILQLHGFYVDEEKKRITFDVVVDFDEQDREGLMKHIIGDVKNALPEYEVVVAMDSDISDQ